MLLLDNVKTLEIDDNRPLQIGICKMQKATDREFCIEIINRID